MNIGQMAEATGVSADTLRFYEKQGLLDPPARGENGYRSYREADLGRVRFVRGAQALGFTLAQIRWILPRLAAGQVNRAEIESHLLAKEAEIDAHIKQLRALKKELRQTFDMLDCVPSSAVSVAQATSKAARKSAVAKPRQRRA
jgi:MerR family copper efflux transcriptional regulator